MAESFRKTADIRIDKRVQENKALLHMVFHYLRMDEAVPRDELTALLESQYPFIREKPESLNLEPPTEGLKGRMSGLNLYTLLEVPEDLKAKAIFLTHLDSEERWLSSFLISNLNHVRDVQGYWDFGVRRLKEALQYSLNYTTPMYRDLK